jgi:broad specificity phosphatase PhoE
MLAPDRCQITELPDLREMEFGNWEGKTYPEIADADPTGIERMMKMDRSFAPEGGEKVGVFLNRVRHSLRAILADPGERLLLVTHGGVIRAALCILLDMNPRKHFHSFEIAPGGSAELLAFDGGAVLRRLASGPRGKKGAP